MLQSAAQVVPRCVIRSFQVLLMVSMTCACSQGGSSGGGGKPAPTVPTVKPNPPVGKVDDTAGFFVEVLTASESAKDQFNIHKGLSTFDEACKGELGKIVDCYVDAEEWSLMSQVFSLHYHVPSDMCAYVSIDPFYFVNRTTTWTTSLKKYTDKNGTIGIDNDADGTVDTTDFGCYTDGGVPICCVGEYPETSFVWDTTLNSYGSPSTTVVKRTITSCLGGPATISQPKTKFGVPRATFEFVEGKGISKEYSLGPLVDHEVGTGWLANFFDPAQHNNNPPVAFNEDIDPGAGEKRFGNPYYTVTCHDSAWENLASIRIQIREWNTMAAFDARKTEPAKYDETGLESDPWPTEDKNDSPDWYDFELKSVTHPNYEYQ